jgi:fatty-acyl-CoA synthase
MALPPADTRYDEDLQWRTRTGRLVPGVEARIVDLAGKTVPADGQSIGEIEVRGPWVTGRYHATTRRIVFTTAGSVPAMSGHSTIAGSSASPIAPRMWIKSGGEWISSVELEGAILAHPDVAEAAVIGIADPRWEERPLSCVVPRPGCQLEVDALRSFLGDRVGRWWIPEAWAWVARLPRTGVGKLDKQALRADFTDGLLPIVRAVSASRG